MIKKIYNPKIIYSLLYLSVFFNVINNLKAQSISMQWGKSFGGPQNDYCRGIAVDAGGNVYTAGSFSGTADFDPGPSTFTLNGGTAGDIFINKLDALGNFLWAKQIGSTTGNDIAYAIALDGSGNVYTTGTFSTTVDFDPGPGTYTMTSFGSYDIFVSKLDPSGNFIWAKQMGGTGFDKSNSIFIDGSGNVYTTGGFLLTADFDPGPSTFNLSCSGGSDTFISKLDAAGNFVSAVGIGQSNGVAESTTIQLDAAGNIYLSGILINVMDFDPGPSTFTLSSAGQYDVFISKYDPSGNFTWAKSFGASNWDHCRSMAVDASGNVYTTGYAEMIVDFDPGPATYTLPIFGMQDIFIHKLDASGNFVWAKRMGFAGSEYGDGICLDASGNIYTTGSFYSTVDFDPGPATYTLSAGAAGNTYVHKLDASGNFLYAKQLPGNGNNWGQAITTDPSGNVYVNGAYTSTVDLDPSLANLIYTSQGMSDGFVVKFNTCTLPVAGTIMGPTTLCSGTGIKTYSIAAVAGALSYSWSAPSGWTGTSTTSVINLQPNSTGGNINVSVFDACGTSSVAVVNITVNATPTISVMSGTICNGQSFTMVPNGASTFSFSSGAAIVSPSINTSYSVTGTSSLGCVSNTPAICSVTVHAIPSLTVNSGAICSGKNFTMVPSGANTYTFSGGAAIVTPTTNTSYSVTGTSAFGCVSSSPVISNVTVNPLPILSVNNGTICEGKSFTIVPSGASSYTYSGGSAIVSPVTTTNYSVSGTNSFGCISSTPAICNVFVNPAPVIAVTSSTICLGQSFTITPSGAITYTFSNGNSIVSPVVNTSYSVSGTNSLGCVSILPAVSNITVHALPVLSISSTGSLICGPPYQGTATLTVFGANTFSWSTSQNTNPIVVSPSITTNYFVTAANSAGCQDTISFTQNVDRCLGISETNKADELLIYPNPFKTQITISLSNLTDEPVQVFDIFGLLLFENKKISLITEIDLGKYPNGVYFIRVGSTNKKIIKQ